MFCTTIIPTIGRDTLQRAVCSVLEQQFSTELFEVVVVNDSAEPLEQEPWQRDPRVTIIETNRRQVAVARNSGAAIAKGRFLHFLDDDDWLLPDAYEQVWQTAQQHPNCAAIYGGYRVQNSRVGTVIEQNLNISGNIFAQIVGGAWLPTMTTFIKTEAFHAVGGFDPKFDLNCEDVDLWARIAITDDFMNISDSVSVLWRENGAGSATHRLNAAPEYNRRARNVALSLSGAFGRLRKSATTPYWHGRVLRAYVITMLWHLRRRSFVHAAGRGAMGLLWLLLNLRAVVSAEFWQALFAHTVPWTDTWA